MCALVTGVQTCALPIYRTTAQIAERGDDHERRKKGHQAKRDRAGSHRISSTHDGLPKRNHGDRQGARLAFPASADMRDRMTPALPSATDVLIVGAGIAGAGLAALLAPHRRVTIIERSEEHTSELQSL